jgi:hypothetical protein
MTQAKYQNVPLEKLIPYARNARKHSDQQVAQIAASIREFGFNSPVLIDQNQNIIAGHGRVLAARKLGLEEVPCVEISHLTENQRRAYILADNQIALNSEWDEEMLSLELSDLRTEDFDLNLTGFNGDAIERFLNPPEPEEATVEYNGKTMAERAESYDESIVRQIVLVYSLPQYDAVMEALGDYAEKHGLSNNVEVVNHLLETNGYAISERTTEEP